MTTVPNHIIRRVHLDISFQGTEQEGFALQNRLSGHCSDWLLPAIEQGLALHAAEHDTWRIDTLELEISALMTDQLEEKLPGLIIQALRQAIREKAVPSASQAPGSHGSSSEVLRQSPAQTAWEAFAYFLDMGRLPWSFRLPKDTGFEQYLHGFLEQQSLESSAVDQVLRALRSQIARRRLVMQFSASFLDTLLRSVSPQASVSVGQIRAALGKSGSSNTASSSLVGFENRLWETAFAHAAAGGNTGAMALAAMTLSALPEAVAPVLPFLKDMISPFLPVFVRLLKEYAGRDFPAMEPQTEKQLQTVFGPLSPEVQAILASKSATASKMEIPTPVSDGSGEWKQGAQTTDSPSDDYGETKKKSETTDSPSDASGQLAQELREDVSDPDHTGRAANDSGYSKQESHTDVDDGFDQSRQASHTSHASKAPAFLTSIPEEGLYIDNAGLVLLHPFLAMCLEGLGLAREGVLLQPERALHLLHFICTGRDAAPEYELIFPKILCNIPLETPVEAEITLTEREKDEATNLLEAAIRWWEALQGASPDALRGNFLCRPGKLSRSDEGDWLLQVEPQSFDILLAQLPWGMSVVRLPWMERMVWVEWG